jgi:hypothetical protein
MCAKVPRGPFHESIIGEVRKTIDAIRKKSVTPNPNQAWFISQIEKAINKIRL